MQKSEENHFGDRLVQKTRSHLFGRKTYSSEAQRLVYTCSDGNDFGRKYRTLSLKLPLREGGLLYDKFMEKI